MPIGYVILTFKFKKEGKKWTALCEELGTATFAKTLEEAKKRIEEAVLLHLNTLEEVGERERFFKEHKITLFIQRPNKIQINDDPSAFFSPYIFPIYEEIIRT